MKIIGGRDYYDGIQAIGGYDSSIIFDRTKGRVVTNKLEVPIESTIDYSFRDTHSTTDFVRIFKVIFAGKLYHGARVKIDIRTNKIDTILWSNDRLDELLDSHELKIFDIKHFLVKPQSNKVPQLGQPEQLQPEQLRWLIVNRVVVASSYCHTSSYNLSQEAFWQINLPTLSGIGFPKVVDPYQAYQQLSQFISNDLATEPDKMVKIADEKIHLIKHGFDKHTFRKLPQKG